MPYWSKKEKDKAIIISIKKTKRFCFQIGTSSYPMYSPVYATCFEIVYIKDTCLILLNTAFSIFCCYLWETNTCEISVFVPDTNIINSKIVLKVLVGCSSNNLYRHSG